MILTESEYAEYLVQHGADPRAALDTARYLYHRYEWGETPFRASIPAKGMDGPALLYPEDY